MKHSRSAGAILLGPNQKVAVVSQHGTSWSLPKGTIEKGEDELTTLHREIKEELGQDNIKVIKKLGSYERFLISKSGGEDKSHRKTITIYLCATDELQLKPEDPDNPEALWVEPGEVAEHLTHPKDQAFYKSKLDEVMTAING